MAGQADGEALGSCGHAGDREDFRRVMVHKDMWALKAILDGKHDTTADRREKVA
jgi:hypothetical protein